MDIEIHEEDILYISAKDHSLALKISVDGFGLCWKPYSLRRDTDGN